MKYLLIDFDKNGSHSYVGPFETQKELLEFKAKYPEQDMELIKSMSPFEYDTFVQWKRVRNNTK